MREAGWGLACVLSCLCVACTSSHSNGDPSCDGSDDCPDGSAEGSTGGMTGGGSGGRHASGGAPASGGSSGGRPASGGASASGGTGGSPIDAGVDGDASVPTEGGTGEDGATTDSGDARPLDDGGGGEDGDARPLDDGGDADTGVEDSCEGGFRLVGDPTCYECPGYTYSLEESFLANRPSTNSIKSGVLDQAAGKVIMTPIDGIPEPTSFGSFDVREADFETSGDKQACSAIVNGNPVITPVIEDGKFVLEMSDLLACEGLTRVYVQAMFVQSGCATRYYSPLSVSIIRNSSGQLGLGCCDGATYPPLRPVYGNLIPKGPARFDDSDPNVVRDLVTDLEWETASDSVTTQLSWAAAKTYCEDLEFDEHTDWRLPTRLELVSRTLFEPTLTETWSATEVYGGFGDAFTVGRVQNTARVSTATRRARCVRGPAISSTRLAPAATGTVHDSVFDLTWQVATGANVGPEEALSYCKDLALDGGGWRVPKIAELETIFDDTLETAIDTSLFPMSSGNYISSTPLTPLDERNFGYVLGYDPFIPYPYDDVKGSVRCVR